MSWPPLYPLILTLFTILGSNPLEAVRLLNAVTVALTVLVASSWLLTRISRRLFAFLGILLTTFSSPLIFVSAHLWTEPLFVLFTVLCLIMIDEYLRGRRRLLLVAAFLAGLTWITRYAGITVVISGAILILLGRGKTKQRDLTAFLAISGTPIVIWIAHNLVVSGTAMGGRSQSNSTLLDNIFRSFEVMSKWFFPEALLSRTHGYIRLTSAIVGIIALAEMLHFQLRHMRKRIPHRGLQSFPFVLYILIYLSFMLFTATTTVFDPLDDRLLVPLHIPLVLLITSVLDSVNLELNTRGRRVKFALSVALLVVSVGNGVLDSFRVIAEIGSDPLGYNSMQWRNSQTMAHLRTITEQADFYSNYPETLYFSAGKVSHYLPAKSDNPTTAVEEFRDMLEDATAPIYLVWLNYDRNGFYSSSELLLVLNLDLVFVGEDGDIYRLVPSSES